MSNKGKNKIHRGPHLNLHVIKFKKQTTTTNNMQLLLLSFGTHVGGRMKMEKRTSSSKHIIFFLFSSKPSFSLSQDQIFNELLTCDAPHLLQDLDTYLGEKEWFIGNSVSMFYTLKNISIYLYMCIYMNKPKTYKNIFKTVLPMVKGQVREQGQKLNF